jgi:DNA-binding transcriptional MocR family regulator
MLPSKRIIAEACGIAVSSVSKALKLLKACGLISVRHNFEAAGRSTILMYSR